jgi:hypothetical protein
LELGRTVPKVLFGKFAFSARTFGTVNLPSVTLERLARLESVMLDEIDELKRRMMDEG